MAGETVIGAIRYDFTANTSGLKSGIAETQEALKKATSGVKDAAKNFNALGKDATDAIKKISPDLSKAQDGFDRLSASAKKNAQEIAAEFKKVGESVKQSQSVGNTPRPPSPPSPPNTPPRPPKNDNDIVAAGFDKWNKSKYDIVAGLSAAAKKAGDDFNQFGSKAAKSVGFARHEMLNLTRQLNDIGVSLAGGMSPFMVLTQQGGQIADVFQSSGASITSVLAQIAGGVARAVFSLKGVGLAVTGIFAGVEAAAMAARDKLADLAEQAKKASVTPETLLGAQVKGAKVGLSNEDVSGALQNANKEFENYKRNTGAVVDSVKEIDKSFLTVLDNTRSFGGWLDAIANKIRLLPATQARDLAESIFPADKAQKFIDLINQGQFSIASFQRAAQAAGGGFSQIANDAAELRIKIAAADEEVNSRLLVSLAKLPTPIGTVASLWTDVKGKIADIIPVIGNMIEIINNALSSLRQAFSLIKSGVSSVASAIGSDLVDAISMLGGSMEPFKAAWDWVISKIGKAIEGAKLLASLYADFTKKADAFVVGEAVTAKKLQAPTPLMAGGFKPAEAGQSQFKPSDMFLSTVGELKGPRTGDTRATYQAAQDAGKSKRSSGDKTDQIKSYIDGLREAAQTAQAEADNWAKGNVEREKAMALVKAENIAKQEGRTLTAAQREEILALSGQEQVAKDRIDEKKYAQDRLNDAMQEFAGTAVDALDSLIVKGQKAADVMRDLLKQLASSALRGLLTGEGAFGKMFGMQGDKEGGLGGLFGKALSFLPKFADGGNLGAGRWGIAGEAGPELIKGPAQIVPFNKMGGQGAKVTVNNYSGEKVEARQMSDGEILVVVGNMIQSNNRKVPGLVADAQRRAL